MGIGQISVSQFAPAFPYGVQPPALEQNLGAIAKFAQANQDVQKRRYENQLLMALLQSGMGQQGQSPLADMTGGQPAYSPENPPPPPPILNGQGQDIPGTGGWNGVPTPPPTSAPTGLASLAAPGGMPIPDVMSNRFNQPQGSLLSRIGNVFNPNGQYTGAPTQIEQMLFGEKLKQMMQDPLDQQLKQAQLAETQANAKRLGQPPTWTPKSKQEYIDVNTAKQKPTYNTEKIDLGDRVKTSTYMDGVLTGYSIDLKGSDPINKKNTVSHVDLGNRVTTEIRDENGNLISQSVQSKGATPGGSGGISPDLAYRMGRDEKKDAATNQEKTKKEITDKRNARAGSIVSVLGGTKDGMVKKFATEQEKTANNPLVVEYNKLADEAGTPQLWWKKMGGNTPLQDYYILVPHIVPQSGKNYNVLDVQE